MDTRFRAIGLFMFLIIISGCATVRVESDYDHSMSFEKYKSFCWLGGCDFKYQGDLDSLRVVEIKLAIEDEMIRKGFVKDENDPDMLLDFHVWLTEEGYEKIIFINDYDFWPEYEPEAYIKGSLIIDIADGESAAMIWQSTTRRYMDPDAEVSANAIKRSVRKALRDFPPQPGPPSGN